MATNQKLLTGTKKSVLEDIQSLHEEFYKKNSKEITRGYYRNYGRYNESLIEKYFGSFTLAKKELKTNKNNITREDIDIKFTNKEKNKKYFISSIIPNAKVNELFWESILNYCEFNQAQPLLFVMRGVNANDSFSETVIDKYSKYFITEYIFNSNLIAKDFMLSPQQILPLSGLQRYGGKKQSLIIAHSKQMLNTIPKQHNETPHIVLSTGTICVPSYSNTRQGQIAKEDNCLAGWIIEVKDNEIFYTRSIRFDGVGFQDFDKYYTSKKVSVEKRANSLIIEPHIGVEDKKALDIFDKVIELYNPKNIFIHDSFDAISVNPHIRNKNGLKIQAALHQNSLKSELDYFGIFLESYELKFPKIKFYHVHSNHNYFVDRYLQDGEFVKDKENIKIGAELFLYMANNLNPIEEYLVRNFNIPNQIFLKKGESFIINNCEMNTHGHIGSNGSRGNFKCIETAYNNAIIGHSHSYNIWRDIIQIPCLCELHQPYNMDGASSWLHGNGVLFENGMKQVIIYIEGDFKL